MFKTIVINISIFIVFLLLLNVASYFILQINDSKSISEQKILPNYKGYEETHKGIVSDMKQYKLGYNAFDGWKANPVTSQYLNIDSTGIRKTIQKKHPDKIAEWWFLGGSVMWGAHNIDGTTIPSIIAQKIDSFHMVNYAEQGFYSRQCLMRLANLYSNGGKPNLVLSLDGINEVNHLCRKDVSKFGHSKSKQIEQFVKINTSTGLKSIAYDLKSLFYGLFLTHTSKVIFKIQIKLFGLKEFTHFDKYICNTNPERAKYVAEQLVNNWEMMHAIVNQNGGKFIALLQPTLPTSIAKKDHIKNRIVPQVEQEVLTVYQHIQEIVKEKNYNWIYDLTKVFDSYNSDFIYTDICHVSYNGNEILSKEILKIIAQQQ